MAEIVAETIEARGVLLCEAGTGTGKTFAYLVPSLLSGRKVIISTYTRALQDQLFYRDLPLVRRALAMPVDAALLKGRGNYSAATVGAERRPRLWGCLAAQLAHVSAWAGRTLMGDVGELGLPTSHRSIPSSPPRRTTAWDKGARRFRRAMSCVRVARHRPRRWWSSTIISCWRT